MAVGIGVRGCILPLLGGVGGPACVAGNCDSGGRVCSTGEEDGMNPKREENPRESGSGEDGGDTRSARGN